MSGAITPPEIDGRRRASLLAAMRRLVPALLPDWRSGVQQGDVADALLSAVASIETEVTKRLDRVPDKQFRNFLDWIGLRRGPARAAELFAVLIAAPTANAIVHALARLRLQAQLPSGPVILRDGSGSAGGARQSHRPRRGGWRRRQILSAPVWNADAGGSEKRSSVAHACRPHCLWCGDRTGDAVAWP